MGRTPMTRRSWMYLWILSVSSGTGVTFPAPDLNMAGGLVVGRGECQGWNWQAGVSLRRF